MPAAPDIPEATRLRWSAIACDDRRHPVERVLACAQLAAADGNTAIGRAILRDGLARLGDVPPGLRHGTVAAAVLCHDFDLASRVVSQACGQAPVVEVALQEADGRARDQNIVHCRTHPPGRLGFELPYSAYLSRHLPFLVTRWLVALPLFVRLFADGAVPEGHLALNVGDVGREPGLAYCTNVEGFHLIPESEFLRQDGYAAIRAVVDGSPVPWSARRPQAFWRGATTGRMEPGLGWRSLPRIKMCQIAQAAPQAGLFDVGISRLELRPDDPGRAEIPQAGLMRPRVELADFQSYRYQINIDGHTSAGALFHKLLTGSPVMKVRSAQGWRQWYYDRLEAWENFVPVESDLGDLVEKTRWLEAHDGAAERIGQSGRRLAEAMTFDTEVAAGALTIAQALLVRV